MPRSVLPAIRKSSPFRVTTTSRSFFLLLLLVLSNVCGQVFAADSIVVSFDRERAYFPGDLIELEVSAFSSEYGQYLLREPRHGSVRYLETQAFPVRRNQIKGYEQKWIVLYQVSRSGDILLQGGILENESFPENEPVSIEPLSIVAEGFGAEIDSNTPETLTDESDAKGRSRWVYVVVALAGIAVGSFGWWRKNQRKERSESERKSPLQEAVRGLIAKLEEGQAPIGDLEHFIVNHSSACSAELRGIIEQTVYSKKGEPAELRDRLRKEFSV